MVELAKLSEGDVRRWSGEASFGRGQSYYRRGQILDPRRQGEAIKGRCLGSQARPYEVSVRLGAAGIVSGTCSCPVGGSGQCKHSAALLLNWVHERESFGEAESLEAALQGRSKAELITLVRRMIERYPDLEMLVDLPTAGSPARLSTARGMMNGARLMASRRHWTRWSSWAMITSWSRIGAMPP